jgi:UDP-N-acetylmuramate--alanine ligase
VSAARSSAAKVETFGLNPGANWWGTDLRRTDWGQRFRVFHDGDFIAEIPLQLAGRHNVLNALAAAALSTAAGAPVDAVRESLAGFRGIRRRFEVVGSFRGITIVDDYAHHPTAVRATLEAARERFGKRRLWCAFQPHQLSRTRALLGEFSASFAAADQTLIAPIYAARESMGAEVEAAGGELARRIASHGAAARYCPSLDRIIATIDDEARPGDVLFTMGAGDIDQVYYEFARRLQRHHAAG